MSEEVWKQFDATMKEVDKTFKMADKTFEQAGKVSEQASKLSDAAREAARKSGQTVFVRQEQDSEGKVIPLTFKNRLRLIRLAFSFARKVRI